MTVAELIAELQKCDPRLQVKMMGLGGYPYVARVETRSLPAIDQPWGQHVDAETWVQLHPPRGF
jgi:hypothetical protein